MKILFGVHQFFPSCYTGTERYVLNLARQLQRMAHRTAVVTYDHETDARGVRPLTGKVDCRRYDYGGVRVVALRHRHGRDPAALVRCWEDPDLYEACRLLMREERWDLYHCAHPMRIVPSVWAARAVGLPVVLMLTDFWTICPRATLLRPSGECCDAPAGGEACGRHCFSAGEGQALKDRFNRMRDLLGSCERILSPSRFLADEIERAGIVPEGTIIHAPHGVVPPESILPLPHAAGKKTVTFGFIGTVLHHKGVHLLVEAFRKLECRQARLQIWGHCFHEEEYLRQVRALAEGDDRISIHGAYAHADLSGIMAGIDVTVVPSIWYENAPLTMMTSLAYGRPVVAANIGGMTEALQGGRNGIGFRAGDAQSLSGVLQRFLEEPDIFQRFEASMVSPPRIEEEAFRTERLYCELLK